MSLSSLAKQEINTREAAFLQQRMKPVVAEFTPALMSKFGIPAAQAVALQDDLLPLAAKEPNEPTKGSNALDALARYIPTEAITLYVAACSALAALAGKVPPEAPYWTYWIFVGLTPVLFLLIFAGQRRAKDLSPFPKFAQWPWWKLIASTIAFGVWSLAVPGTPYLKGEVGGIVAAFLAILVSTFLTLLEPIFQSRQTGP